LAISRLKEEYFQGVTPIPKLKSIQAFWTEMSSCDHFVQIYEDDEVFMDTLSEFIAAGLRAGHTPVIIAEPAHRLGLTTRLMAKGFDVSALQNAGQLFLLDAEKTLEKFMVCGWPDPQLFQKTIMDILTQASANGRQVIAFGEMVSLLWEQGQHAAVIRLEQLWNDLCRQESLTLFCAYPKSLFRDKTSNALPHICSMHSKILEDKQNRR
jgi:hypothetical protein